VDTRQFIGIEPSQKYRIANKICDELKKNCQISCDFMIFINPNATEVRKLLIALISKISSMDDSKENNTATMTYEEKVAA